MDQLFQISGALMILAAFVATQLDLMSPHSVAYLVLNLVGSSVLSIEATLGNDWGFLLLEGVWAVVSAWGLVQLGRGKRPEPSG